MWNNRNTGNSYYLALNIYWKLIFYKCVPTSNDIALHSKRLDLQSPLAWVINKGPYQGYWNLDRRRREHSCLSSRKKISLGAGQGLVDQNQNKNSGMAALAASGR